MVAVLFTEMGVTDESDDELLRDGGGEDVVGNALCRHVYFFTKKENNLYSTTLQFPEQLLKTV